IDSIGISPVSYLVIPRMIGVTVSCVVLTIYFNIASYLGGWLIANYLNPLPFSSYINSILKTISIADFAQTIIKSLVFGILISLISTYHGFQVKKAITQVPQRTIKAVVYCLSSIIIFNVIISLMFAIL
ncbi:MAG: ABC transporter permease, partial [Candidatus Cloacimonetes bacterium]|nr:ABC transporter permease [Candidatus Cloacimonadota bacterium]